MPKSMSLMVLSVIFNGEVVTSHTHEYDLKLYEKLPSLYAVLIAQGDSGPRKIVGGCILKTTLPREPTKPFQEAVTGLIALSPPLLAIASQPHRLLPAKLNVVGSSPFPEEELLRILLHQRLKWEAAASRA